MPSPKQVSRFFLIIMMLASIALVVVGNIFPLFSMSSPRTEFSSWKICKTSGGQYACYTKFSTPAATAECTEMDDRTTSVAVFSLIWILAALQTIFVMVWELCGGGQVPMRNLHGMLFAWTGGIGVALTILMSQTLIASLCQSPLSFTEETGKMELGGILLCSGGGASALGFAAYAMAPSNEGIDPQQEQQRARKRDIKKDTPSSAPSSAASPA